MTCVLEAAPEAIPLTTNVRSTVHGTSGLENGAGEGIESPLWLQHSALCKHFSSSHLISKTYKRPQLVRGLQNVRPARALAGCPSGFARQRPAVDHRRVFNVDMRVTKPSRQSVGQPRESGQPVSLTGHPRGPWKTEGGSGYAWATRGTPYMCRYARQRLVVGGFSGSVMGISQAV